MYHEIGDGPNTLFVSVNSFRTQMEYLKVHGYRTITMAQAHEMLESGNIPPKTVAITFDDGYATFYKDALPILQEYNFTATVYVISSYPGLYPNYMTWEQILAVQQRGIEIGSHTQTHPALTTVSVERLRSEIAGSKHVLEEKTGVNIGSFCYPTGAVDQNVAAAAKQAGYSSAVTTVFRNATPYDDPYLIPRDRISRLATMTNFAQYLR